MGDTTISISSRPLWEAIEMIVQGWSSNKFPCLSCDRSMHCRNLATARACAFHQGPSCSRCGALKVKMA